MCQGLEWPGPSSVTHDEYACVEGLVVTVAADNNNSASQVGGRGACQWECVGSQ